MKKSLDDMKPLWMLEEEAWKRERRTERFPWLIIFAGLLFWAGCMYGTWIFAVSRVVCP